MKKIFIIFYILTSSSYASYEILDTKYIYTIKMKSGSFEDTFIQLKNEIAHNSYVIINELNLAKSTNNIAKVLDKKEILNKGKTLLICKGTFALQMFGLNEKGKTCCLFVEGYQPFFYVKVDSNWGNSERIALKIKLEEEMGRGAY